MSKGTITNRLSGQTLRGEYTRRTSYEFEFKIDHTTTSNRFAHSDWVYKEDEPKYTPGWYVSTLGAEDIERGRRAPNLWYVDSDGKFLEHTLNETGVGTAGLRDEPRNLRPFKKLNLKGALYA